MDRERRVMERDLKRKLMEFNVEHLSKAALDQDQSRRFIQERLPRVQDRLAWTDLESVRTQQQSEVDNVQ